MELFIPKSQIAETVQRLARQIEADYPDEMPLLVGVLKGSFIFMADLVREIQRELEIDFLRTSSYGSQTSSSGRVKLQMGVSTPLKDRSALVVEDIVDTGLTTAYAKRYLRRRGASSVKGVRLSGQAVPQGGAGVAGLRRLHRAGQVPSGLRPGLRPAVPLPA